MNTQRSTKWGLATTLSVVAMMTGVAGFAAESKQERAERIALNAIKSKLPIKGDRDTTWYVIQFDTITKTTTNLGSVTRTTVRSSVRMDKFQGQDVAAKAVLEFLTSSTPGTKAWYRDAFPDSDWGRTQMEKQMERLRLSGAIKGYR